MTTPTRLTAEQYQPAQALLEGALHRTRPRIHSIHDVYTAIVYKLESRLAFRDLPDDFPPWRSCHEMYLVWTTLQSEGRCLLEIALEACDRKAAIEELHRLLKRRRLSSAMPGL